uniref:Uncharacterized protein n=1 Tax=Setaria digitata TaxID=48799 RepID=A0A915PF57_9BILA
MPLKASGNEITLLKKSAMVALEPASNEFCSLATVDMETSVSWHNGLSRSSKELDEEEQIMWASLVDELNLDGSLLYNILSSWDKSPLRSEQIVDAYFEYIKEQKIKTSRSKELLEIREKEKLLQELLEEEPTIDENILAQIIAASFSNSKHVVLAEYCRRKMQTLEFNRRLMQGQRLCISPNLYSVPDGHLSSWCVCVVCQGASFEPNVLVGSLDKFQNIPHGFSE